MRKKRRVLKNGANSKAVEKSSMEDLSTSEIEKKRKKPTNSKKLLNKSDSENESMNTHGSDTHVEASTCTNPICDGDSSDSSSNEFAKPDLDLIGMENIESREEAFNDDFATIEDNILGDVGRLSGSDESDFEEVLPTPMPVKKEAQVNKTISPQKRDPSPIKKKNDYNTGNKRKSAKKTAKPKEKKSPQASQKVSAKKVGSKRMSTSKKAVVQEKGEENKPIVDVNAMDITQLLAMGESVADSCKEKALPFDDSQASSEDESEEEDWEEVDGDVEIKQEEKPHVIPKEGVQITLDAPDLSWKRKKKGFDLEACLKRRLNRNKRQVQVLIHKVHLLCWIAHGRYINLVLNSEKLMGLGLSLIPSKHCYPPNRTDLDYLEKIVQWFRKYIPVVAPEKTQPYVSLEESLEKQFQSKKAYSKKDLVLMFVSMMRSLGIKARLVLSLQPAPLKPPSHELCSIKPKNLAAEKVKPSKSIEGTELSPILEEGPSTSKTPVKTQNKVTKPGGKLSSAKVVDSEKKNEPNKKANSKLEKKVEKVTEKSKGKMKEAVPEKNEKPVQVPKSSRSQRCKKNTHYRESDSSDFEEVMQLKRKGDKKSPKVNVVSKKAPAKKGTPVKNEKKVSSSDYDSDFEPEVLSIRKGKSLVAPKDRKVLSMSSDSEGQEVSKTPKKKEGVDVWAEVYLEMEEKWISVDVPLGKVHCVVELHGKATSPVLYILAYDNDLCLKDVTRRYCPQWLSITQKKRVNERWWNRTLRPFLPKRSAFNRREEEEMDEELESRPMPTNITEYKNHPMYALRRHLLKFEAIYPPDAPSLGFIRGEPVFPRDCVHQLHSRETWIKEAKVVKLGEKPYKIVKARPKYDRMSGKVVTDLPLELFGIWQVDDYMPPPAVDGKVPRNEYGNVDLYKPCMLPKGTVHLRLPALNRVAKKLQIDCAPAVTGFDFHSGGSHPTFDGYIVCEEYKDILTEAWSQEQDEQEKRYREKREKRVYGNWIRLVRGLLIRESLQRKYSFGEVGESSSGKKRKTSKKKS